MVESGQFQQIKETVDNNAADTLLDSLILALQNEPEMVGELSEKNILMCKVPLMKVLILQHH